MSDNEIIIGIDLGTTNSCVGIWRNNNFEVICDKNGNRTVPSIVAFSSRHKYIGREAKKQIEINPKNTFYEIKRLIGKKFDEDSVINDSKFLTYNISKDEQNNVTINPSLSNYKHSYTPEELSAFILMEIKSMAEDYLKIPVKKAIITVPAYFNDSQRQATKDAATIAGLECIRIINEPTAAALAYGLQKLSREEDVHIIVYDLGGGTLDVSLLNISNGIFEVKASSGNTHLGGADFDNRLINFCINKFKKVNNYENINNISPFSFQKLKQACEEAKKRLSEVNKTIIAVKDFYDGKNLFINITRQEFEKICRDLFILCLKSIDDVLKACNLDKKDIGEIILVGGGTRIPAIKENIKMYFNGKEPNCSTNPDEVVACGAAIQGFMLSNKDDPFSEGVVLLDIIPLSLGVETIGGVMNVIVPRNSVIPLKKTKKYTTDSDYQTEVDVKIFEGERQLTKDNFLVGNFTLSGIESAPRGIAQIEITFNIDVNGIINVSAIDKKNEKNNATIIINSNKGRLSKEQIEQLIEEAKNAKHNDDAEKQKKQLYYEIDDLCHNVKENIIHADNKLKDSDKEIIQTDIARILEWLTEKEYFERQHREYTSLIDQLKKKYGTLIIKMANDDNNVQGSATNNISATSVYQNDIAEDDDEIYEKIEEEEFGISNICDPEIKKELIRLRETLLNLCYSIMDIISNLDNVTKIKEQINDIILWVYVKENISIDDYKLKIDEANSIANDLADNYNDNDTQIKTSRSELEESCYALLGTINSDLSGIHINEIDKLENKIHETLDWLIELDIEQRKFEIEGKIFKINDDVFQDKIDEINGICEDLYNIINNIQINDNINIFEKIDEINFSGTSIQSLIKK